MWPIASVVDEEKQYFNEVAKMCRGKKGKIFIWGAGVRGTLMGYSLERIGITDFSYIDSSVEKQRNKLNGRNIFSSDILRESQENFVIVSVENNSEIIAHLESIGYREGKNYLVLNPIADEIYLKALNSVVKEKQLVLGGSILRNVELDDERNCLAEMIEEVYDVQVLAMNAMPLSIAYFVLSNLSYRNMLPGEVTIVLGYEMFSDCNHLLPRTQKLNIVKQLMDTGYDREELEAYYERAQERAQDYFVERQHSPYRDGDEVNKIREGAGAYMERLFGGGFSPMNESFTYFRRIIALMESKNVRGNFVWEPVNYQQYEKYLGEKYTNTVETLLRQVDGAVGSDMRIFKYNHLLDDRYFVAFHTVSEAVKADGREAFVRKLSNVFT